MQPCISTKITSVFRSLGPVRPMLFSKVKRSHITRILRRVFGLVFRRVITSLYKNLPIYPCVHISVNIWISEGEVKRGGEWKSVKDESITSKKKNKKKTTTKRSEPLMELSTQMPAKRSSRKDSKTVLWWLHCTNKSRKQERIFPFLQWFSPVQFFTLLRCK